MELRLGTSAPDLTDREHLNPNLPEFEIKLTMTCVIEVLWLINPMMLPNIQRLSARCSMMAVRRLSQDISLAMETSNIVGRRTGPPATSHPPSLNRRQVLADLHGGGMSKGDMQNILGMARTIIKETGLMNSRNGILLTTANGTTGDAFKSVRGICVGRSVTAFPHVCAARSVTVLLYAYNQLPLHFAWTILIPFITPYSVETREMISPRAVRIIA